MSTIQADLDQRLDEGERLKKLGIDQEELDREFAQAIFADIDAVLEKRHEVAIRYAILTTIDDGDPVDGKAWTIDHPFPDVANDSRIRFCDAIVEYLKKEEWL